MPKEIFHNSIVIAVSLSAHTLANAFLFQHCDILFVPVVPTLVGMQNEVRVMLDLASTISKQHMDVVKLKYQGHGVREIAGVLNLTVKEVRSLLAQARDVLMELCYGCRLLP